MLYASSLMPSACCIHPYLYAYPAVLYSLRDLARQLPCAGPTSVEQIDGSIQLTGHFASASINAAFLAPRESAFFDPRSSPSNDKAVPDFY